MPETLEQRISDLEQIVLRQAERLEALEERLELAQRLTALPLTKDLPRPTDKAA